MTRKRSEIVLNRLPTGIPALDSITGGGIPVYSACVISGVPGAGKTILTQQILFANATPDSKSLYLTTVSEPAAKVVRYQQQFEFFDADKVGEEFIYMDLGEIIREQGPSKSLEVFTKLMQDFGPRQLAIDSFRALHDLIPDREMFREFVFELAVKLSSWSTTAFLVGEYTRDEVHHSPEFSIADTIIDLSLVPSAGATRRYLEVLKLRGSDFVSGRHMYKITEKGFNLFPRIFVSLETGVSLGQDKVATGVSQLDDLLDGGFPRKAVVAVTGSAGTGKSLMGLHFVCEGAHRFNEPGLYLSFEESHSQLENFATSFGWPVRDLIDRDLLRIHYRQPLDLSPEEQLIELRSMIQEIGAKRVVIDSLTPLMGVSGEEDVRQIAYQMALLIKESGATGIVISDVPVGSERISRFGPEESVFDGIVIMKNVLTNGRRERFLEVYKMRSAKHIAGDHRFKITDNGIVVFPKPGEVDRFGD